MALIYTWESFIRIHGGEEGARNVFEIAMKELIQAENPDKEVHRVKASQGDGGIDVYVHHKSGIDIYQCKFFMGSMNSSRWSQIQHSFDRAMEPKEVKVLRWFICVPREMQQEDIGKWNSFLETNSTYGIPIRYIDGDEIIKRMQECDRRLKTALINNFFGSQTNSEIQSLPSIIEGKIPTCEPYIDGVSRKTDLENIGAILKSSKKVLWLYGYGGIGKTELVRRFADTHSEYEYIFITYKGSINQSISQNLFSLPEYENEGRELSDEERLQRNHTLFKKYSDALQLDNRNLIIVIDNYYPAIYEKKFHEETDIDIETGFAGDINDIRELQALRKKGVRIILTSRIKPQDSDIFISYKVRNMCENDLFKLMTACFTEIQPYLGDKNINDGLRSLINITESRTAFVSIMAYAMQNSGMPPKKALNQMLRNMDSDTKYYVGYTDEALRMQEHMEKILGFMQLTYQENLVLTILTMLPSNGMEYDFFRKLTLLNSAQLNMQRKTALWRLIDSHIVYLEERVKATVSKTAIEDATNFSVKTKVIRLNPLIAECTLRKMTGLHVKGVLNSIKINWIFNLMHYFDEEHLKKITPNDNKYPYISLLADACSATELALQKLGEHFSYAEDDICDSRRELLYKAADLSDKAGFVKDAIEYTERAIAVEGPSSKDIHLLGRRLNKIGIIYKHGARYSEAKKSFLASLKLMNDYNQMEINNTDCPDEYKIEELILLGNSGINYASLFANIGGLCHIQGDYEQALKYLVKAVAINERLLGVDHFLTAGAYNNLGSLYRDLRNNELAIVYFEKAVPILERQLGTDHPDTKCLYNNMAIVYEDMGEHEKATEFLEKAFAIYEQDLCTEHQETAMKYNNLATVFHAQGNHEKALEYFEMAMGIRKRILGTGHPATATTYNNMAVEYEKMGEYKKALEYFEEALPIFIRTLGENHRYTKDTKQSIERIKKIIN